MTTAAIVASLFGTACFGWAAALAAPRLPPRHATWVISVGAVSSALSATVVLALLAFALVGQADPLADEGRWSSSALHDHALAGPGVGAMAVAAVVAAALAALLAARRQLTALLAAHRACRAAAPAAGELVVVPEGAPEAVALPGRPGRIVIGASLLAALSAGERRALLAHEQAHLRHGHHWHRAAVFLAAAANPLLVPLRSSIVQATERWADEDAAAIVGSRRQVAEALARVALISRRGTAPGALAAASHAVPNRVMSLLARPSTPRPMLTAAIVAMPLVAAIAAALIWKETEHLFELAGRVQRLSGG